MKTRLGAALLWLIWLTAPTFAGTIWVEGESPTKKETQTNGWYDTVKKDVLSGGNWLAHYGNKPGEASYAIDVPTADKFTFWARLNPVASQPQWQLDDGAWTAVNFQDKRGQQNIAQDNRADHRFIAWVKLGQLDLKAGQHTVRFRWEGGAANSGGLDCFVLTTEPFVPQGTLKPGANVAEGPATAADPKEAIWIEGEAPAKQAMNRHPWWYDQVKKDILSGGDWISNFDKAKEGTAEYAFEVLEPDEYALWIRANAGPGAKLSYQLDGGQWTEIDFKAARGLQNIAADNKPDLRFIAWAKGENAKLTAGKHLITFKMHSGEGASNHGALDCFVFTRIPFIPNGIQKPTVIRAAGGPGEWFPLLADEDPLDPKSVIDLSKYIPAPAGQFGFLQASGKDLKFASGKAPVKFWGCGANVEPGHFTREQLAHRAKFLRKFGINIVRQHPVYDELTTNGQLDPKKLDEYDYWFAQLKANGIYTDWSVFYHFTIGPNDNYPQELFKELEGGARKDTYGTICMSPQLWELRNKVMVELLQHKNPYTQLRYVDDPALAVVEMNNEDSIFFWNPLGWLAEGKKMPKHSQQLRANWAAWVKAKYKTDADLEKAWGKLRAGDSVTAKELQLMAPWELPGNGPQGTFAGQPRRAGDYIQFLAELQHQNFSTCEKALRGAGFKAVSVTTGWQVGGAATDPANTWTDCVGSMIDRHNYAGGGAGGHGIAEGKVNNESHLKAPGSGLFTVGMKQVENKPFSITEWTQSPPNQWKLEAAPIMAFYAMGLQGWDASFHFMQSSTRLGDGWPGMSSYKTETPHYLGQFPALAFAIYHGHIQEGPLVAARRATLPEIFSGTDPFKQDFTKGGYDIKTLSSNGGTPAEAFAIGRTTVAFEGGSTEQVELTKYWNEPQKVIQSATGELTWDYGRETIVVRAPKTQAVIGKTGNGTFDLPGVTASFQTPFVSFICTPLDDQPLATSKRILITALAQDKQAGTRYNADGTLLEAVGTAPLLLEPVQAKLKFAGAKPQTVVPCDHYGTPRPKDALKVEADGTFTIDGRARAYYYVLQR